MQKSGNNGLGRYGEEVAARWLTQGGLRILERNWRCAEGELDIVALDGDTLAVCEVKTRSERGFQSPTQAIDQAKADRLRRLAERWLDERWPIHFDRLVRAVATGRPGADAPGTDPPGTERAGPAVTDIPRPAPEEPTSGDAPDPPGQPAKASGRSRKPRKRSSPARPTGGRTAAAAASPAPGPVQTLLAPVPPGGVRIDLVAVVNRFKGAAQVEHLRGAI